MKLLATSICDEELAESGSPFYFLPARQDLTIPRTSATVYHNETITKGATFSGFWNVEVNILPDDEPYQQNTLLLLYNKKVNHYRGYSDVQETSSDGYAWVEIQSFDPARKQLTLKMIRSDERLAPIAIDVEIVASGSIVQSVDNEESRYSLRMSRPW